MEFDPAGRPPKEIYRLLISCVVPRPIAFVSTISAAGVPNIAPFSFFNAFSADPPTVGIGPGLRAGRKKDTLRNIEATGEFVVHIVDEPLAARMNQASAAYPPEVSEFAETGLTPVPSRLVRPPRAAEAPIAMECRRLQVIPIGKAGHLVLGEVVSFHVRDELLVDGAVDPARLRAIGRFGGDWYCRTRDLFTMARPADPPTGG